MADNKRMIKQIAAGLAASWLAFAPAQAAPPAGDFFSRTTGTPSASPAGAAAPTDSSKADNEKIVKWFEAFDDKIAAAKPTQADHVKLVRPFNKEAERVQEWIDIATRVATNYRKLAKDLKSMPAPDTISGAREYRDLTADWYADAACVYEDLVHPRPRAKTMEELEERIDEIKQRAQGLKEANAHLQEMDRALRLKYKVHPARHEDALQQYITRR